MGSIKSYTNRHGRTVHYDEAGNKVGESYRSPSGGRILHYDAQGNETGRSYGNPSGRMTHYDASGSRMGTSYTAYPGRIRHYGADGQKTGDTIPSFWGTTTQSNEPKESGCPERNPGAPSDSSRQAVSHSHGCAALLLLCAAAGLIGLIGACLRLG